MSDMALSFAAQKEVPGIVYWVRVAGLRVDGDINGRVLDTSAIDISYDILVWTQSIKNYILKLQPVNRAARNVKINSAARGTPCRVVLNKWLGPKLYLDGEEIPFATCTPTTPP